MAVVSIHHREQEGESDNAEHCWVDLSVGWNIVHVHYELVDPRDVSLLEVGRWIYP